MLAQAPAENTSTRSIRSNDKYRLNHTLHFSPYLVHLHIRPVAGLGTYHRRDTSNLPSIRYVEETAPHPGRNPEVPVLDSRSAMPIRDRAKSNYSPIPG